jgi:hypothetical protein
MVIHPHYLFKKTNFILYFLAPTCATRVQNTTGRRIFFVRLCLCTNSFSASLIPMKSYVINHDYKNMCNHEEARSILLNSSDCMELISFSLRYFTKQSVSQSIHRWNGTSSVQAQIRTRHLRDTCPEGYRSVLPDTLITTELVKTSPVLSGTQIFVIVFIRPRHRLLSKSSWIQSTALKNHVKPNIFSITPRFLPLRFSNYNFTRTSPLFATWLAHLIPLDLIIHKYR